MTAKMINCPQCGLHAVCDDVEIFRVLGAARFYYHCEPCQWQWCVDAIGELVTSEAMG